MLHTTYFIAVEVEELNWQKFHVWTKLPIDGYSRRANFGRSVVRGAF